MSDRFVSSRYRGQASTPMSSSVDRATRYADVINFSLGDPELTTDGRVIDAAMADAHRGHTHYTDTFGYPDLREEILRVYAHDHGHTHDPAGVLVTTSACKWAGRKTLAGCHTTVNAPPDGTASISEKAQSGVCPSRCHACPEPRSTISRPMRCPSFQSYSRRIRLFPRVSVPSCSAARHSA